MTSFSDTFFSQGRLAAPCSVLRKSVFVLLALLFVCVQTARPQTPTDELTGILQQYFANYKATNFRPNAQPRFLGCDYDAETGTLRIESDASFASQPLTPRIVKDIYASVRSVLPEAYKNCAIIILADGRELDTCIPNPYLATPDARKTWGNIDYAGAPWVANTSKPFLPTLGLQNRHLSVCASHGRYYRNDVNDWRWQRPNLFCTNEDLLTQTIVVPYLLPMLENAGAIVYSPRERDWQRHEVIVDNDTPTAAGAYMETQGDVAWEKSSARGFANPRALYVDGENPFTLGTARNVPTVSPGTRTSEAAWIPNIPESGRYAVYVSYQTLPNAVSTAQYTVNHCGIATHFSVNQKMGGGTWVYLGTFYFEKGQDRKNSVVLTNKSPERGAVSADAVRFGGGMGNIARGYNEETGDMFASGLPRYLEGARYSAQWAGMPYDAYAPYGGDNDYKDDINARSYATNHLAGGSVFLPSTGGCKVPIELCFAVHTDAGYRDNDFVGTLGVCTTNGMGGEAVYPAGVSRSVSNDFVQMLIDNVSADIAEKFGLNWSRREVYDRIYSESCRPDIPSAIIEMLSHQNFNDMLWAHNPEFKFLMARSIYKGILRYVSFMHNKPCVVAPLAPDNFSVEFVSDNEVQLRWNAVDDKQEPTAKPDGYVVYTRIGNGDFDNGTYVRGATACRIPVQTGTVYSFRVTAVNKGGESFPTETLAACRAKTEHRPMLIVNCFDRLSGPAVVNTPDSAGFDINADAGVPYIQWPALAGAQQAFDRTRGGDGSASGLGRSGNELCGEMIAGNTFDYVAAHGRALAHEYSFVSCSKKAVESGAVSLSKYPAVDLIFGLNKASAPTGDRFKALSPRLLEAVRQYVSAGGHVLASGAYLGADMTSDAERSFLAQTLHCSYAGSDHNTDNSEVKGMNVSFHLLRTLNSKHYAAQSVDRFAPLGDAKAIFHYSDGQPAGVSCRLGKGKSVVLGFPIECVDEEAVFNKIMLNLAHYLQND